MDHLRALAGHRAAVRFRVGERAGRPLLTDAVGEVAFDGADLVVTTRKGPVRIAPGDVVAARAVPPAVPRRASWAAVARLEELCADAWPALADERLGAWRLRAAGGYTGRANAALAVGDPGVPVGAALDAVRAFAAAHGVPPRVTVPMGSPWDTAVAGAGWVLDAGHEAGAEVAVLVADLAALPRPDGPWTIDLPERPTPEWWALGLRGGEPSAAQRHVLDPGGEPRTAFALARDAAGGSVGQVRATVVQDHLHLSWLEVVPAARRRGLGTALVGAAAAWGRGHGARFGVLQVALHNTAARGLYAASGWTEHHRYRYLVPPGPVRA
ncbi:MAG: GNAT family N-acetyltransferase [Pseudonocardiales bacterium]|nr:GNAT family N-acetyltransferase [Pseudonocardiales bacterium]